MPSTKCHQCARDVSNFGNPVRTIDEKIYCDTNCYKEWVSELCKCGHDVECHERYHDRDSYGNDVESEQCNKCDCIYFTYGNATHEVKNET